MKLSRRTIQMPSRSHALRRRTSLLLCAPIVAILHILVRSDTAVYGSEIGSPVEYQTLGKCENPSAGEGPHNQNKLSLLFDAKGWRHHLTKENTGDLDHFFNVYFGEALRMMPCPITYWTQFDLIVSFHARSYVRYLLYPERYVFSPTFGISPKELNFGNVDTWEKKSDWRSWMINHGFSNLVASAIDPENPTFPCVLKTNLNQIGGRESDVMETQEQLNSFISRFNLKSSANAYSLEEPLTGMRMGRAFAHGSAYKGNVLALRCAIEKLSNITHPKIEPKGPDWAKVNALKEDYAYLAGTRSYTPCGRIMVANIHKVLHTANYTGPFCINYRRDSKGQMIMLDMTPRICVSMMKHPELLVSSLVPLAYTIRTQDLPSLPPSHVVNARPALPAPLNEEIQMLMNSEREVALGRTCGDIKQSSQMGFKGDVKYKYSFFCDGAKRPASSIRSIVQAIVPSVVAEASASAAAVAAVPSRQQIKEAQLQRVREAGKNRAEQTLKELQLARSAALPPPPVPRPTAPALPLAPPSPSPPPPSASASIEGASSIPIQQQLQQVPLDTSYPQSNKERMQAMRERHQQLRNQRKPSGAITSATTATTTTATPLAPIAPPGTAAQPLQSRPQAPIAPVAPALAQPVAAASTPLTEVASPPQPPATTASVAGPTNPVVAGVPAVQGMGQAIGQGQGQGVQQATATPTNLAQMTAEDAKRAEIARKAEKAKHRLAAMQAVAAQNYAALRESASSSSAAPASFPPAGSAMVNIPAATTTGAGAADGKVAPAAALPSPVSSSAGVGAGSLPSPVTRTTVPTASLPSPLNSPAVVSSSTSSSANPGVKASEGKSGVLSPGASSSGAAGRGGLRGNAPSTAVLPAGAVSTTSTPPVAPAAAATASSVASPITVSPVVTQAPAVSTTTPAGTTTATTAITTTSTPLSPSTAVGVPVVAAGGVTGSSVPSAPAVITNPAPATAPTTTTKTTTAAPPTTAAAEAAAQTTTAQPETTSAASAQVVESKPTPAKTRASKPSFFQRLFGGGGGGKL